jgi:putative phosphoribosyl transferase
MNYKMFKDRAEAAKELTEKIKNYLRSIDINEDTEDYISLIVLAIPRGGVITGDVIASRLRCSMDIIVSRKIGAEYNPELAIGALMPDGSYFINKDIANALNTSQEYIDKQVKIQNKEIERRLIEFRGSKDYGNKLDKKIVILVDDGIATGSTIIASARWIREKHNCRMLIVAVPVAPATNDTIDKLDQIADKVIVLYLPQEFYAVGQFYRNFDQVEDDKVKEIMKKYI